MSNCRWCGSKIVFGGPRCCDQGVAKRNREAEIQVVLEVRLATMERRIAALEQRLSTLLEVNGDAGRDGAHTFGLPGVRDSDHPCIMFYPGEPSGFGDCRGDGHGLCRECTRLDVSEETP